MDSENNRNNRRSNYD